MAQVNEESAVSVLCAPPERVRKEAHISDMNTYYQLYDQSIRDPEGFWGKISNEFYWKSPPTGKFFDYNFDYTKGSIFIKWMEGATTNVCYNLLDRNIERGHGDKIAFYWEGNDPADHGKVTYRKLRDNVCQFANVLKNLGVQKGDRVAIYMPMIIELTVAMLACARIGAIHSVVFGGYSSDALADRILDAKCCLIVTADGMWRGTKLVNLKDIADGALQICKQSGFSVDYCVVVKHLSLPDGKILDGIQNKSDEPPAKRPTRKLKINWFAGRDKWWHDLISDEMETSCEPQWLDAEDPLFMLYTSGSTGKPKGVVHTCGGYMLYVATTFKYVFDYHPDDIFWCTADIGWITGHSCVCYGPLANAATGIIFEGIPNYPDCGHLWEIVEKYKVTKFYTAPTVIRSLMKVSDDFVTKSDRSSLKILGTAGEPINPEAWLWYYNVVGNKQCAIVDTFWQTESGGPVLTPLPGATPTKPGSATFPFFGIVACILTDEGKEIKGPGEGCLVFQKPWPGIMRTIYENKERFVTTYFKKFPGYYFTGDGVRRDEDGYIWVTGRIDDMVNVSGHLLSTAEIESALIEHPSVSEAAVVAYPHKVKGECTYCFVTLKDGFEFTEQLVAELKDKVRSKIGPFAQPDYIQNAPALPKTRSGKIMRRILKKIAVGDDNLGDTSTLSDESVIQTLIELRPHNITGLAN